MNNLAQFFILFCTLFVILVWIAYNYYKDNDNKTEEDDEED